MTSAQASGTDGGAAPTQLEKLRERYPWLDHLVRAGARYTDKHGDHYAAAITYFSILALVPIIMIAFAAAAFVLAGNQELLAQLQQGIQSAVPPELAGMISGVVDQAIAQRNAVAMIGLGLAFAVSFAITAIGSGLSATILEFLGLGDQAWARFLFFLAGLVITLAANWLVFLWVLARLPREPVT